jgi:NADH:ubiquinone reductase (H+-translocating)
MVSKAATWPVWAALHVMALPLLQNRFRVQAQWFRSCVTGQRSSRLISEAPRPIDAVEQKALP